MQLCRAHPVLSRTVGRFLALDLSQGTAFSSRCPRLACAQSVSNGSRAGQKPPAPPEEAGGLIIAPIFKLPFAPIPPVVGRSGKARERPPLSWLVSAHNSFVLARISSQLMSTPRTHLVSGHDFNRAVMAPITWGFSPCHESGYPLVTPLFQRGVNRRSTTYHHVTPVTSTSVPVCDSQLSRIQSIRSPLSWGVDGGPFHGSIHFTRIPLTGFGAQRDFFCVSVQY
jgi:hypothetical protein